MTTATLQHESEEIAADAKSKKPAQTFRNRNLSASVFENESKNGGTFFSVTLQRTYKDGEEFKHSSSFTRDEIPVARYLLDQAWEYMLKADSK